MMIGLQKHMTHEEKLQRGWIDKDGNINPGFKTVEQGASTSVWGAISPELENKGGLYLEDCSVSVCRESPQDCYTNLSGKQFFDIFLWK